MTSAEQGGSAGPTLFGHDVDVAVLLARAAQPGAGAGAAARAGAPRLADLLPGVRALPAATREVLLLAALHGDGDLAVLQAAAGGDLLARLAVAERGRLVQVHEDSGRLEFHHPLVGSTVVEVASPLERRRAHRALADALPDEPVRRAWHLAYATAGVDEHVAALLEQAAALSLQRGDGAGAAHALGRAAELSPDEEQRRRRLVRAAALDAEVVGDLGTARSLLARAGDGTTAAGLLPATVAAAAVLLNAEADINGAYRLLREGIGRHPGPGRADDAVLVDALHLLVMTTWYAGRPELWSGLDRAVAALRPAPPAVLDLCVRTLGDPVRLAAPVLSRLDAVLDGLTTETDPVHITRVALACVYVDRVAECREALARVVRQGRSGSAVALAISAMVSSCVDDWTSGQWDEALALAEDATRLAERNGYRRHTTLLAWYVQALVDAARGGHGAEALLAADDLAEWAGPRGVAMASQVAHHVRALVALGAGRWEQAYAAATAVSPAGVLPAWTPHALWVAFDLVESAVRAGRPVEAAAHAQALQEAGVARLSSRLELVTLGAAALAADDESAFDRALAVPEAARWPFEQARICLAYAEHLRRRRELPRARDQFRDALETLDRLGARPWAARAAAGLRASGRATTRAEAPDTADIPARDWEIVRLATSGLTNRQIGERLHLSHRTVGGVLYHLYPRFGITSRAALSEVLHRWGPAAH